MHADFPACIVWELKLSKTRNFYSLKKRYVLETGMALCLLISLPCSWKTKRCSVILMTSYYGSLSMIIFVFIVFGLNISLGVGSYKMHELLRSGGSCVVVILNTSSAEIIMVIMLFNLSNIFIRNSSHSHAEVTAPLSHRAVLNMYSYWMYHSILHQMPHCGSLDAQQQTCQVWSKSDERFSSFSNNMQTNRFLALHLDAKTK